MKQVLQLLLPVATLVGFISCGEQVTNKCAGIVCKVPGKPRCDPNTGMCVAATGGGKGGGAGGGSGKGGGTAGKGGGTAAAGGGTAASGGGTAAAGGGTAASGGGTAAAGGGTAAAGGGTAAAGGGTAAAGGGTAAAGGGTAAAGGGTAAGGGAAGGGTGGGVQAGENCSNPIELTPGNADVNGDTSNYLIGVATFAGGNCSSLNNYGKDIIYTVTIPAMKTLYVTVTPTGWDASVYILADGVCASSVSACLVAKDTTGNVAESILYANNTSSSMKVYVVVDGNDANNSGGAFTINVSAP